MIRVQHGRGGWQSRTGMAGRAAVLAIACIGLFAAGCSSSSKQHAKEQAAPSTAGQKGLGETSLQQLKSGTINSGASGPLQDIHFAFNDYTIQPQDNSILKSNADWLMAHPQTRVQVEGHCDERGSEDYNIALGARRAQAAKDYLETLGISASRISTISYGKELPLCTEHTESCWAENRRDHFVVSR
jgi:peptidoglycan-associated lipoprotein